MGWDVTVVDADPEALRRMREDIYPTRYGAWDASIHQYKSGEEPRGKFDIIMIGTPPNVRLSVALKALEENPKILFLEKPVSFPFDPALKKLSTRLAKNKIIGLVGYDHAVAKSIQYVDELLSKKVAGDVLTIDVDFREHWQGIFKAHPWLSGPQDSYLGYWRKGGGASGEHSHALHLWQHLARQAGIGTWKKIFSHLKLEKKGKTEYDSVASFLFESERGAAGRVIQDVVTMPTRKLARIQGTDGYIEWICNGHATGDIVRWGRGVEVQEEVFPKTRPDDFYAEMLHINDILNKKVLPKNSPLALESGIAVMRVLETAWSSRSSMGIMKK